MSDIHERFGDNLPMMVTIVTTEHMALESARSATTFETNGRISSYLAAISGSLVALALIGETSKPGQTFLVFMLVILPALALIGLITFNRTIQSGIEDGLLGRRVNRLRRFYTSLEPGLVDFIMPPSPNDDPETITLQSGFNLGRMQLLLTASGMVGVLDSIIFGVLFGVLSQLLIDSLAVAVPVGVIGFIVSTGLHYIYQERSWDHAWQLVDSE